MRNKFSIIIILLIILMMSGCSVTDFDTQTIMRPPRPTGEKADIQVAIEKSAGTDIVLKYPQRGEYRSAIIMHDLLREEREQAVVLYSPNNDSTSTHVMVVDKKEKRWVIVGEFSNEGNDVDKICFADINDDGKDEIIIGWSTFNNASNKISAYSYNGEKVKVIPIDETYTDFVAMDFDNDKREEILLISLSGTSSPAAAKLIKFNKDANCMSTVGIVELDSDVTKYMNVSAGKISGNQLGVIIDGKKLSNIVTELVYWDSNKHKLLAPLYDPKAPEKNFAVRPVSVYSKDVNNDGIIEIPILAKMLGYENSLVSESLYITNWSVFDTKTNLSSVIKSAVQNIYEDYYLNIPDSWANKFTARVDNNTKTLTFSKWVVNENNIGAAGSTILKIKVVPQKEWIQESGSYNDYNVVLEKNNKVYLAFIPKDLEGLSINLEYIKENLILI